MDESQLSENLEVALNNAQRDQKEAFIFACQQFINLIHDKINGFDLEQVDITCSDWWRWVVGGFNQMFRMFHVEIKTFKVTLDMIVFTDKVDKRVLRVWNEAVEIYDRI